jgi:hypothetical protein
MYQAVTVLGLRFTLDQFNAAAKQMQPIPNRKVKKANFKRAIAGARNNFEVVRINNQLVCDGITFDGELAALSYSRFPQFRDQESGVFEIDHEEGISTACLSDSGRAVAALFTVPAIAMLSGEDGDDIVVATTDQKLILINDTDDPYASYDKQIPLAEIIAAGSALKELAAGLRKQGLPSVQPFIISLRKYVG